MLSELLVSIIAQGLDEEIEVVISDDASPDDTVAVANTYRGRINNLTILEHQKNIGMDRNFLAVTAAATGDYIWLMGDDDQVETGGAQRVLDALDRWPDVVGLTIGVVDYDPTMTTPTGLRSMPPTGILRGAAAVFTQMIDVLGFMSALVIKRELWEAQVASPSIQAANNYYVQVLVLGQAIGLDGEWGVVDEPCVRFRSSNDQLKAKLGWLDRLKIDVRAYDEIADVLFKEAPATHSAVRRRVLNTHILAHITNAKCAPKGSSKMLGAVFLLFRHYYRIGSFWTRVLPLMLMPAPLVKFARKAYRRLAASSGAARARRLATPN